MARSSSRRRNQTSNSNSLAAIKHGIQAMFGFAAVWWMALLYTHTLLPSEEDTMEQNNILDELHPILPGANVNEQKSTAVNHKNQHNPYYGWQPDPDPNESSCSIRTCFPAEPAHKCPACRDSVEQLGPAPPVMDDDWIPDVTMLHRMLLDGHDAQGNPWPPPLSSEYCEAIGVQGGKVDGNRQLFDAVPIVGKPASATTAGPTIFCGVYTMESAHATSIRGMRETWAPHCDGFLAFSTASDPRLPAMNIPHEGPEEYNNMWQKSRAIWKFIGDHYLDDFDYFILGGDDLFVIPNNLRAYLDSLQASPEDDLFAGRRFKGYGKDNYFNSGGAGYVLSRGTLRKYATIGYEHPQCSPHRHTAMEDVMIADCLRHVFGIGLVDTRDAELRERFHPFSPGTHLVWKPPKEGEKKDWYEDYNSEWGLLLGAQCCAPDSVSFHYMKKPAMVRHLYSLLYHC